MKILMCTSEAVPFAKTGGLADMVSALSLALAKLGHEIR
ncbi:MAG: glycogen/starch synthase, partial [Spirochaetaceae bacterium]|nr:glycogen/starch synthase [Spirochaetaceae bacterium]